MDTASQSPVDRSSHLQRRAKQLFDDHFLQLHAGIDRMFVVLMSAQWVFSILAVLWLTPYSWEGATRHTHPHVWMAIVLGGVLTLPSTIAGLWFPGRRTTRLLISVCQVGYSSLLIHLTGGRIETHFHVFGSLAFLAAYRDWTVLLPATVLVALDHLVRGLFWPESVFGVVTSSNWRWLEHAAWVLFEDLWLVICCRQGIHEVRDIARNRAELEQSQAELKRQTMALEESLHQREAIVEGALDAVVQTDCFGKITNWNSQASNLFGWSECEVIGRLLTDAIVSDRDQAIRSDNLQRCFANGISKFLNQRIEVEGMRRDGATFPIELAITPIVSNGHSSFCAFVRDISERRQSEERLKQAKEVAETANEAKSRFLANMSHEIRTPLNAILGFADLMRDNDTSLTSEERKSHLEIISRGGTHLLTVINDILDLSKIEAGEMQYERIRFSPHQVIVDTLSFMRVRGVEKGLTLDSRWLGRVPETIVGDPSRFRQMLLNLIGNAMKFTERGSVQILARLNSEKELLQIEIIDTGIGIAPNKIETLFTPFTQADVSVTRRFGGTGLGLSICRHIARSLGGEIIVQSVEGQGSTFTITVSTGSLAGVELLESPPQEALTTVVPSVNETKVQLDGLDLLVVDDGETNRQLLRLLLTRAGAAVQMAENGQTALEFAKKHSFDVIVMDMQMPVLDGYSATRELRKRGITTPVIALTAHAMSGEDKKCYDAGCDFYLTKPVDSQELVTTLSRLRSSRLNVSSRLVESSCTDSFCPSEELDESSLSSGLDLSDPEIREIVCLFVERLSHDMDRLKSVWEKRDWTALNQNAHALKGTAAMTGFAALSTTASQLEESAEHRDEIKSSQALVSLLELAERIRSSNEFVASSQLAM